MKPKKLAFIYHFSIQLCIVRLIICVILNKFSFRIICYSSINQMHDVITQTNAVVFICCLFVYAAFVSNHKEIHTHSTIHWNVCKIDGMVESRIMTGMGIEQWTWRYYDTQFNSLTLCYAHEIVDGIYDLLLLCFVHRLRKTVSPIQPKIVIYCKWMNNATRKNGCVRFAL